MDLRKIHIIFEVEPNKQEIVMQEKSNHTGTVLSVIVALVVMVIIKQFLFRTPSYDKMLLNMANELNKNLPIMVDKETRLDHTMALPGKSFSYQYTLINTVIDSLNVDVFVDYMEPQILNMVKTNPDLQPFRDNKVTLNYNYKDKEGVSVAKISITPEMYTLH